MRPVETVVERWGRLDVLVNNTGAGAILVRPRLHCQATGTARVLSTYHYTLRAMTDHASPNEEHTFASLRPRLFSIAYRMLGTRADAEDVVQDAWLRWHGSEQAGLQS